MNTFHSFACLSLLSISGILAIHSVVPARVAHVPVQIKPPKPQIGGEVTLRVMVKLTGSMSAHKSTTKETDSENSVANEKLSDQISVSIVDNYRWKIISQDVKDPVWSDSSMYSELISKQQKHYGGGGGSSSAESHGSVRDYDLQTGKEILRNESAETHTGWSYVLHKDPDVDLGERAGGIQVYPAKGKYEFIHAGQFIGSALDVVKSEFKASGVMSAKSNDTDGTTMPVEFSGDGGASGAFSFESDMTDERWDKKLSGSFPAGKPSFTFSGSATRSYRAPTNQDPESGSSTMMGTVTVSYSLSYSVKPIKYKMELRGEDPGWIPTPFNDKTGRYGKVEQVPLVFSTQFKSKDGKNLTAAETPEGRIDFYLTDVTRHKGECCNYPKNKPEKSDLRFSAKQGDADIVVDPNNPLHAYTTKKVTSAAVMVEAMDTGAYGELRAECSELGVIAECVRTKDLVVSIPSDDNRNEIADAWEKSNGVFTKSYAKDWDQENTPQGGHDGDGLSLYQEYRGFIVLEKQERVYRRLDPKEKELFVLDEALCTDAVAWKEASESVLVNLDQTLVKNTGDREREWRIADFNGESVKYAMFIEKVPGMVDEALHTSPDQSTCYAEPVSNAVPLSSPKECLRVRIFPDRIADAAYRAYKLAVEDAIDGRNVKTAAALQQMAKEKGWDPVTARQKAMDAVTAWSKLFKVVIPEATRWVLVHEMSHGAGVTGHRRPDPKTGAMEESTAGIQGCPMAYPDSVFRFHMVMSGGALVTRMLGHTTLCEVGQDRCLLHLKLKDN
jgi:hypothetical protein